MAAFSLSGRASCCSRDLGTSLENVAQKAGVGELREMLKVRGKAQSLKELLATYLIIFSATIYTQ